MLALLSIRDIVLIDRLDLEFSAGMIVLTGETGAGKSILLDALSLALGSRGDAGLVRANQSQGQVTAVFDVADNHPVRDILKSNDIEENSDIILRRVQSADGRAKAYINDQPVSVNLLRDVGTSLVEIHGQHDDRALVDSASHRDLLDAFGNLEDKAKEVSTAWKSAKSAIREYENHKEHLDIILKEQEYLRNSVEELSTLDPKPGEEEELAGKRQRMMQVEKIASDIAEVFGYLSESSSPIPELAGLMRRIERKSDQSGDILKEPLQSLGNAIDSLEEARSGFESALRETQFDPQVLESTEVRLFALRAAGRKFSVPVEELQTVRAKMEADLSNLESSEEKLEELKELMDSTQADFERKATNLSELRKKVARTFETTVNSELPDLKLERSKFVVDIRSDKESASESGIDQVEFWVQTNPGTKPGPLMKVASGGELSRFLLALKVSLADKGSAPTLVFDEIDTGVGGAVAEAIGSRLSKLSEKVQVLSVTHAPQVAVKASGHFLIDKKSAGKDRVTTEVEQIEDDRKLEEIARMLAGAEITDEARAAAGRLIADNKR